MMSGNESKRARDARRSLLKARGVLKAQTTAMRVATASVKSVQVEMIKASCAYIRAALTDKCRLASAWHDARHRADGVLAAQKEVQRSLSEAEAAYSECHKKFTDIRDETPAFKTMSEFESANFRAMEAVKSALGGTCRRGGRAVK